MNIIFIIIFIFIFFFQTFLFFLRNNTTKLPNDARFLEGGKAQMCQQVIAG